MSFLQTIVRPSHARFDSSAAWSVTQMQLFLGNNDSFFRGFDDTGRDVLEFKNF